MATRDKKSLFSQYPWTVILLGSLISGVAVWSAFKEAEEQRNKPFQEKYVKTYASCDAEYGGGRSIIFDCSNEKGNIVKLFRQLRYFHPEISVIKIANRSGRKDVYTFTLHEGLPAE